MRQAVCGAAVSTGKMRVALVFGAVICEFKVPGPFSQIGLVNQTGVNEAFKGSINCDFIRSAEAEYFGDLPAA